MVTCSSVVVLTFVWWNNSCERVRVGARGLHKTQANQTGMWVVGVRAEKSPDAVRVEALSPIPKYLVLLLWIAQIRQVVVMLSRPRQSLQSDGC